ncbi:hypothetical protein [Stenotrophomonas maltophilia]|nr:hypothetical protein [Stenotrophomonas maltophilia]
MKENENAPSRSQRIPLLIGWGFVIGSAALAVPLRVMEIVRCCA